MLEVERHVVADFRATTANVNVGALAHCHVAEQEALPVNVGVEIGVQAFFGALDSDVAIVRGVAAGNASLIIKAHEVGAIEEVREVTLEVKRVFEADAYAGLRVIVTAFGFNDHNAVSTAGTIDCSCGCVLQDRERFDVLGGDVVEVRSRDFNVVEKNQRGLTATESADTADEELGGATGLTATGRRNDTCDFTGEGGSQVAGGEAEVVALNRGDSTGHGHALLSTRANDYDFVESVAGTFQFNFYETEVFNGHAHFVVAYITNKQNHLFVRRDSQREVTVDVGCGNCGFVADNRHGCTGKRFTVLSVENNAGDRTLGGRSGSGSARRLRQSVGADGGHQCEGRGKNHAFPPINFVTIHR